MAVAVKVVCPKRLRAHADRPAQREGHVPGEQDAEFQTFDHAPCCTSQCVGTLADFAKSALALHG